MQDIRVIHIVFLFMAGVISSVPPVVADTENAYARCHLVVNRQDPTDPTSPPPATIIDPLLRNPWGAAIRSAGLGVHIWLANAASATVTTYIGDVYDESGQFVPLYQDTKTASSSSPSKAHPSARFSAARTPTSR